MPITNIKIKNCKSLKDITLSITDISCLIGENGTGKSNILEAVKYFYDNLTDIKVNNDLYDKNNPYVDYIEITLTYDISTFLRISDKNLINSIFSDNISHSIFKTIYKLEKEYAENNLIKLTLRQYKNHAPEWSIDNYEDRALIKNLFPIYFVDTRNLKLTNWEELWDIAGDLSRIKKSFREKVSDGSIKEFISKICGEENYKTIEYIKNEFKEKDITVNNFNFKEIFTHFLQLDLEGKIFNYKEKNLNYFSDGMNSYNYLNILVNLVSKISERKLKDPLLIFDEPEIGLHPSYIDDLIDNFSSKIKNINILLATHSPRIIRNIIRENFSYNMFHISLENYYTQINKMKKMENKDERLRYRVSEAESSFYFSRGIVFVEGQTELELFSNENLLNLFPFIKKIDFFHYSSDILYKIIHPSMQNFNVPYIVLVDLDKILSYIKKKRIFTFINDKFVNPITDEDIKEKEKFFYGSKRLIYHLKNQIYELKKEEFLFEENWYYTKENNRFEFFKNSILNYCLNYNIFTLDTTIEGTLVNKYNYKIFYKWIQNKVGNINKLEEIYNFRDDILYKVTVLRLLVNGKYDNLTKLLDENKIESKINSSEVRKIYKYIYDIKFGKNEKANGWVTEFLNYFFSKYQRKSDLKKYFPEFYDIMDNIKKRLK